MKNSTAICAGSFDPPSYGHINIIERALDVFDKVIVAIAYHNSKTGLFTADERISIFKELLKDEKRVEFDCFEGLLVEYAKTKGVKTLVRGIRTVADYEYELQMSIANRRLSPDIDTLFFMSEGKYSHVSSSIIKSVIKLGGSGTGLIHPYVEEKMKEKFSSEK